MKTIHLNEEKTDLLALKLDGYKYCILLRDHYRGNGKGEYFACENYAKIKDQQPFWFTNTERPVHTVILTNEDVPGIIAKRRDIVQNLLALEVAFNQIKPPAKDWDGRKTRRTAPELFAEYDRKMEAYKNAKQTAEALLRIERDRLRELPPYISSTLLYIEL